MVRDTSFEAYKTYVLPKRNSQFVMIMDLIDSSPKDNWTAREVEEELENQGTPMRGSSVAGRVSDMKKMKILIEIGKRQCSVSGANATYFTLSDQYEMWSQKQEELNEAETAFWAESEAIKRAEEELGILSLFDTAIIERKKEWKKFGLELGLDVVKQ